MIIGQTKPNSSICLALSAGGEEGGSVIEAQTENLLRNSPVSKGLFRTDSVITLRKPQG